VHYKFRHTGQVDPGVSFVSGLAALYNLYDHDFAAVIHVSILDHW
jgi:hypothetical protein